MRSRTRRRAARSHWRWGPTRTVRGPASTTPAVGINEADLPRGPRTVLVGHPAPVRPCRPPACARSHSQPDSTAPRTNARSAAQHPHRFLRQVGFQHHARTLRGDPVRGQHIVNDLVPVPTLSNAGCTAPRVDLRHLEQIVDHLGEPNRLLLNRFSRAPGLRNRGTTPSAIASDTARIPASGLCAGHG